MNKDGVSTHLGLDFGGTKLLIGEIADDGSILRSKRYPSGYLDQEQALSLIQASLDDYIGTGSWPHGTPDSMGMGLVGRVDYAEGIWTFIDPARHTPIPMARILGEKYGMRCNIDNDVKTATRAEMLFGSGRHDPDFVYLNLGTGIAAGIVSHGRIVRGIHNDAGEIGHMIVDYKSDVVCACGQKGCVEAIASGSGLETRYRAESGGTTMNARAIFAADSDPLAKKLGAEAVDAIAVLIMNLVRISDPRTIVLGGGMSRDQVLLSRLRKRLDPVVVEGLRLTPSTIDPAMVALIGAASLGMTH